MGLCLSMTLWKEKAAVYASGARRGVDPDDEVMLGGASCYGLLGVGGGDLEVDKAAAPRAAAGGVAGGGTTPARPIWQRRVPMGIKCQLPRFSGMILYDERGRPVCGGGGGVWDRARDQENHAAAITVLRECL